MTTTLRHLRQAMMAEAVPHIISDVERRRKLADDARRRWLGHQGEQER